MKNRKIHGIILCIILYKMRHGTNELLVSCLKTIILYVNENLKYFLIGMRLFPMKIGIDFGTFYSSAAVMIGDTLKLVKDPVRHGYAFPSSVFITKQGEVLVGQAAENQRLKDLSRYRREFKRELGQDIPVILGDRSFRVEEIIAEVLKKLKEEAMLLDGGEVRDAVITVPAMYAQYKKKLMETAGKAAGFEVTLLEEPVAAATYYNWQSNGNHCSSDEEIILVFDLGGGTFDVALVQKKVLIMSF